MSRLIELGGFRPTMYLEMDVVDFDPARAEEALNRLVRRHEHLRTVILAEGTQRVLDQAEQAPFRLTVLDLTGLDARHQETAIRQVRERMSEQGPDPTAWPLFEIVAHRIRRHRARVHFAMSLLLLDSRSTRHVQAEWWQLYRDPAAVLPPVQRTFRECLLSQVAQEDTGAYQEHWRYWEARLDGLPDAPQLPLARPLASIDPVRLSRRTCQLRRDQWQRFCANAREHRILPNTALLHVFAEAIGGWACTPHFSLNVLHQSWATNHPEAADAVGQFSATLPLEVDLRQSGDFWVRGQQLQRQLWRDMAHSDVTGVRVTRELASRRGWTSRAALPYVFNSMLGPAGQAAALSRPACRTVTGSLRTPQVLIDNQLLDGPDGGIACVWDMVADAFPPGLDAEMFEAYQGMLETLSGPDGALAQPSPVSLHHRDLVAADNAGTGRPVMDRLEDGFLSRAATLANAPAVVTGQLTLSYGEVEAASRAVAGWLSERGVARGDIVPVVMAKGWEQVVAVLGVLRAGAAYCPIDADLPAERIRHLLDECSARVVLNQSHHSPDLSAGRPVEVLHVDQGADPSGPLPALGGSATDLAYIIYTSGSTGRPKGVMIEHRAALNTVLDVNERVGLAAGDRVFGISSLSFDLSVWDIFGTLAAGATIVLPAATSRPDPIAWATAAHTHGVTVWNSVPALAEMLVEVAEQRTPDARPPIRAFLLSGDWVPASLPERARRLWPRARVIAMGGATEASIWSNSYEVARIDPDWRSIPYGRPLRDQTMRVLDHRLGVCPPWAVGRIHIGGTGLALGYWRDEERTAERFIRHPVTGERLYWTGDLGRYWPDGTIEFLGREDRQLKIQGFRVEPGEIESVIREHAAVRDCAVGLQDAPGGQRRLISLVVARDGAQLDGQTIAAELRSRLPHYMVPGQIHIVDGIPLSPNGKVDIAGALADVSASPVSAVAPGGAGANGQLIQRLASLWAELLEVPTVGPDSDFFALGGNSLLALRLVNRIRNDFDIAVPFGQIFEAPTVRALAGRIDQGHSPARCAVTLSTGEGPELFLFHPVGGSVASYIGLARAWPGPVHAFQRRALVDDDPASLDTDLETMAAGYREELQRLTPRGPFLLGGWSMGGVLAYEVARQLAESGHQSSIFMIDSDIHNVRLPATEVDRHLEFMADLAGGRLPVDAITAVREVAAEELARTARDVSVAHALLPVEVDAAGYQRLMRVHSHNLAALAGYQPDKSAQPTLLLVAGEVDRPNPIPAWRTVCPGIEVDVWSHDHYSMIGAQQSSAIAHRVCAWLAGLA
jgi:amino acid adenylation domain-containing protein